MLGRNMLGRNMPKQEMPEREGDRTRDGADAALTVYYDGACPLCAAEIRTYRRSRGAERVRWVDVGGEGGAADLGPGLTRREAQARFHVRDAGGTLASGAAGFTALWSQLPGWRWLGRAMRLPGIPALAEAAYRLFLPHRPKLARLVAWRAARGGGG